MWVSVRCADVGPTPWRAIRTQVTSLTISRSQRPLDLGEVHPHRHLAMRRRELLIDLALPHVRVTVIQTQRARGGTDQRPGG